VYSVRAGGYPGLPEKEEGRKHAEQLIVYQMKTHKYLKIEVFLSYFYYFFTIPSVF
jgi:hypothetical protein